MNLTDIEIYRENCPTDLADDESIKEAVNIIIGAMNSPHPVSIMSAERRNAHFGKLIVNAIDMITENFRAEHEADTEFENKLHLPARNG